MSTRIAVIDKDKCAKEKCGYQCIKACPGVRMGEETIVTGEDGFPIISEQLCSGCGICVKKCPYEAIKIVNLPFETGKPIYQYGTNEFRLYGLPLPKENSVVGLVGANGVGKSTALKILSGKIKPNLGREEEAGAEEILEMFRGNEIQSYLEKLYKTGANVVYKPQSVDKLATDVVLGEFLKNFGDNKRIKEVVEDFELKNCLKRKLKELSGGELQRAALAVVFLKTADVYYIDEPSSYLDIKQRIKMVRLIKDKLVDKPVLVVEHDLAVLDYLSDYVHVFFGEPSAYGMVSGLKGARVGINEFLEGYLKEENIRFRDHIIKFEMKGETESGEKGFDYPELHKKFDGFELKCSGGRIKKGETLGILGANGIGKTTFIKMLAGKEMPTKGEVEFAMDIAYKPQYLTGEDTLVMSYLNEKTDEEILSELKHRLQLGPLMMKNIMHLSGGELQRVSIAKCLASDADLLLLDEPSAFLDIEQRMACAETIKKVVKKYEKTAFVVDHDIAFIDAIANRLIVFEGEPGKVGKADEPQTVRDGMNKFLKEMNITMRREKQSGRPRINKQDSVIDREQKAKGEYYYYFEEK